MLENKKLNKGTNRKVNDESSTKETIDVFNSGLYYKVTISSWERYDAGSL